MSPRNAPPPDDVVEAIEDGTARVTRRLEIYEADASTFWVPTGTPVGGSVQNRLLTESSSVTIDMTRDERRMMDLSLDNADNLLHPNPFGGFWYDKVLKIYKGVELHDGSLWEAPLGRFLIDGLDYDDFPNIIKVTGRDFTKKMMNSKITQSQSYDETRKSGTVVKNLAINAGIDPLMIDVPADSPPLGKQLDFERGTSRWDMAKQIATAAQCYLYFDASGWLVMEAMVDPYLTPPVFTFKTGKDGNLVKYTRSITDSNLYNHVVVKTEASGDSLGFFGEAINTDPNSPTRVDKVGDRYQEWTINSVPSDAVAASLAARFLAVSGLESYVMNISSIAYPWVDVGVVSKILDPKARPGDPDNYLMDTATIQLGPGPMDATGKRITVVGGTNDPYVDISDPATTSPGDPPGTPDPTPDPPGPTGGSDQIIGVATYNIGSGPDDSKVDDLEKLVKHGADVIGCQEGNDRGAVFDKFLKKRDTWAIWRGDDSAKRADAVLYKKGLGTVVAKRAVLGHARQYVGEHGTSPTIRDKYVMRVDIKLSKSLRTVSFLNNHLVPSATMSKSALGATEWQKRRDFFQAQIAALTAQLDSISNNAIVTGDFNATASFDLMAPLMSRINNDHSYITLDTRTIDFVGHKTAGTKLSKDRDDQVLTTSDHDAVIVFYNVSAA